MSKYIVSARKYRPTRFDEVVGQDHIVQTLKNAVAGGKIAQAYLFCGPRGVGKTTCARILAKSINCENPVEGSEACGECPSCLAFQSQASFNIHELDAASNNSVDDMRALTEQVRYPPQSGKYKIYIIDEVHMLSQSAFNAFLKTLEEPPPYAVFILATTEKHRILPTILSRCQIFDFKRIEVPAIVAQLKDVAAREALEYEEDALHIIAQKADGALRDALSIFDRLASFPEGRLSYEQVLRNLNILDYDYYFRISEAIVSEDHARLLRYFDEILRMGFEGETFINGLARHFRDLLMCKEKETLPLLELSENLKARYAEQAAYIPSGLLLSALDLANKAGIEYRYSKNKRLTIELALLKICYLFRALESPRVEMPDDAGLKKKRAPEPVEEKKAAEPAPSPAKTRPQKEAARPEEGEASPAKAPEAKEEATAEESAAPVPRAKKGSLRSHEELMQELLRKRKTAPEKADNRPGMQAPRPDIAEDRFFAAWKKLLEQLKKREDVSLHTILKHYAPRFRDGYLIQLAVANSMQAQIMSNARIELLDLLSSELQANGLELVIDVDSTLEARNTGEEKHFTVDDKLRLLHEQNPDFELLRQKLGLEPDF